jgi:hypothetical protein
MHWLGPIFVNASYAYKTSIPARAGMTGLIEVPKMQIQALASLSRLKRAGRRTSA